MAGLSHSFLQRDPQLNTCTTDDCSATKYARGLCRACYRRAQRRGELDSYPLTPQVGRHSLTEVDVERATAVCAICGPTSIRVRRDGKAHECMTVRSRNRGIGSEAWPARIKRRYGLSVDDYAKLWLEQDGACAICLVDADLFIDHCHDTGEVRGLLCHYCNAALGLMRDDPARLLRAIDYLPRAQTA